MTVDEPSTVARSNFLSFAESPLSIANLHLAPLPSKEAAHSIPIVIDAGTTIMLLLDLDISVGSYRFRAGYANESKPSRTTKSGVLILYTAV